MRSSRSSTEQTRPTSRLLPPLGFPSRSPAIMITVRGLPLAHGQPRLSSRFSRDGILLKYPSTITETARRGTTSRTTSPVISTSFVRVVDELPLKGKISRRPLVPSAPLTGHLSRSSELPTLVAFPAGVLFLILSMTSRLDPISLRLPLDKRTSDTQHVHGLDIKPSKISSTVYGAVRSTPLVPLSPAPNGSLLPCTSEPDRSLTFPYLVPSFTLDLRRTLRS